MLLITKVWIQNNFTFQCNNIHIHYGLRYKCCWYCGWDLCSKLIFYLDGWQHSKNNLGHLEQEMYKCIFVIVRNVTTLQHGSKTWCELNVVKIRHAIYTVACWVMTDWLSYVYMFKKVTDIIEWLVIFLRLWRGGQLPVAYSLGDLHVPTNWLTYKLTN